MRQADKAIVAQLTLDWNTYYVADREGITIDGQAYTNAITRVGIPKYMGNIGDISRAATIDSFSMQLVNGESFVDNGYLFDVTDVWQNMTAEVKIWTSGDSAWSDCEAFANGIIKNFDISESAVSFDIDNWDPRDDKLLPAGVCRDQSGDTFEDSTFAAASPGDTTLTVDVPSIFEEDMFVILIANDGTGNSEVKQIKTIAGNRVTLRDAIRYTYTRAKPASVIRKAWVNLPEDSDGKTIPIQIGDLDDRDNGVFAKGLATSDKIGEQRIIFDGVDLRSSTIGVGVWDDSLKRFFVGRKEQLVGSSTEGEYTIDNGQNAVLFQVNRGLTLAADIVDTVSKWETITVNDYTLIDWSDEVVEVGWFTVPKVLGQCLLHIDNEVMIVAEKPTSNSVLVERGISGTSVSQHSSGANIYQPTKFAAKNMLSFTAKFPALGVANQYFLAGNGAGNPDYIDILQNKWDNMTDDDSSTYFEADYGTAIAIGGSKRSILNWDIKFKTVELDADVWRAFIAIKCDYSVTSGSGSSEVSLQLGIGNPSENSPRDLDMYDSGDDAYWTWVICVVDDSSDTTSNSVDTYNNDSPTRETITTDDSGTYSTDMVKPNLNSDDVWSYASAGLKEAGTNFLPTTLDSLNDKWKICTKLAVLNETDIATYNLKIYNIGLWLDFFLSFIDKPIMMPCEGRPVTQDCVDICGEESPPTRVGQLAQSPLDVLALLLTQEMGYATTDFTDNWVYTHSYYDNPLNFGVSSPQNIPAVAFSYGIDDKRKKGWEWCSEIAQHFNLVIYRDYAGNIDVANMHRVYYDPPSGNEINIEDVLFAVGSKRRRITVKHTGTDLIYNDVVVKYKRNNSTNSYQATYVLPDDYALEQTPYSVKTARETFYGSRKKTLEIESQYIYNEDDARRLAEWQANDRATSHMFVQVILDMDHWTDINQLAEQYKIGDVLYLTGKHGGIEFSSSNRFYVQNVRFPDGPREIELHLWSLQSITDFTTTATTGEFLWDDTGGDGYITGDYVKDDTGGTGVTGDDVKDDTGG